MKPFWLYLVRWQLSSPVLAVVLYVLADFPLIWAVVVSNLIGGMMFYYVDRWILCR